MGERKLVQISVDSMAWIRLRVMKPPELKSMGEWAARILEQHSVEGDKAAKLMTRGLVSQKQHESLARRVQYLEDNLKKSADLPIIEDAKPMPEQTSTLPEVSLHTLSLAELRRWGEAYAITARTKKPLLKALQSIQDRLLGLVEEE